MWSAPWGEPIGRLVMTTISVFFNTIDLTDSQIETVPPGEQVPLRAL